MAVTAELVFVSGELAGQVFPIDTANFRVGRAPEMDLVLPPADQRFVSRSHSMLILGERGLKVVDLGSTNGTWVNGRRVNEAELRNGDEVQFGRSGPIARVRLLGASISTVAVIGSDDPVRPPIPLATPPAGRLDPWSASSSPSSQSPDSERPSQLVRRIVDETLERHRSRPGRGGLRMGAAVLVATLVVLMAAAQVGWPDRADGRFVRYETEYLDRVLLIEFGILLDDDYYSMGHGSGFVADESGLIVTNKHVIEGWHYSRDTACLVESMRRRGIDLDQAIVISAWRGGSRFRQSVNTQADRGLGYSTEYGTLEVAAVAADNLAAQRRITCSDLFGGRDFTMLWASHMDDNNDLAVLRVATPLPAIPLATRLPEPDDPVMVFGFPRGLGPLETNDAIPIRRVGSVLRTQETVQIDAVVLHGNSGGPLINSRGEVVGVTTRGPAESLNMAIKVEFVLPLLERARQSL